MSSPSMRRRILEGYDGDTSRRLRTEEEACHEHTQDPYQGFSQPRGRFSRRHDFE